MITLNEILRGKTLLDQGEPIRANLAVLLVRVNKVRAAWGKPMIVTSGLRTKEDQVRVYKEKAEKAGVPFDESKVPMGSQHLKGAAVDIADEGLVITKWLKENPEVLEKAELWAEEGNKNWVHLQIVPPKSGNRWFLP